MARKSTADDFTVVKTAVRECTVVSVAYVDDTNEGRAYQEYSWQAEDGSPLLGRMYFDNTSEGVNRHGSYPVDSTQLRTITLKERNKDGKVLLDVWYAGFSRNSAI